MPADEQLDPDEYRASRFNHLMGERQLQHGRLVNGSNNVLRARGQLIREEVANERFDVQHQELDLKRAVALANLAKQRSEIARQIQTQEHTVNAIQKIGSLDSSAPDYHTKLAEVFQSNPLAARDPMVQDMVRGQIASRHVMEQSRAAIEQSEGTQANEFARIHGVNPVRNQDTGRIDWAASQKVADDARVERQKAAVAGIASGLTPSETVVRGDGTITQTFKAQTLPAAAQARALKLTADIAGAQVNADKTQEYIDAENNNLESATSTKAKKDFQDKIDSLNEAKQGHINKISAMTAERDAMAKSTPVVPTASGAVVIPNVATNSHVGATGNETPSVAEPSADAAAPGNDTIFPIPYKSPESVRDAFRSGFLNQDEAAQILRSQFGHQ